MLSLAWLEVWRWCRQREMYWTAAGSLPTTPYSGLNKKGWVETNYNLMEINL